MGYSKEIYEEVQRKLYKMRNKAWDETNRKKEIFYKRFPQAKEIEKELSLTSIEVAKAILKGSDSSSELCKLREKNKTLREKLSDILKSVNLREDYLEIKYNCEKCQDEGFIDGVMCDCMKDMLKKEAYDRLNDFSPLDVSSFENFSLDYYSDSSRNGEQSPKKRMSCILNFCKGYAANFKKDSSSLLMTGSTGLGKTHLSLAIANEVINRGFGVIYSSTQNMISNMEKGKFKSFFDCNPSEKYYSECDLLIIDDLGTEYSTSFSSAVIYSVINSRIMRRRPTIISTNLSMRELEKYYNQRMVSRIIGNNIRLEFLGTDIRQKLMKISKK